MSNADEVNMNWIEEATWGTTPSGSYSGTATVVSATNTVTAASGLDVFSAGQRVLFGGWAGSADNTYRTVVSANATTLVLDSMTTDEAGATVTIDTTASALRFTKEDLGQDTDSVESNEIRGDRQISEVKRTAIRGVGGTDHELSYGSYDTFLAMALQSSGWSSIVTLTATDISAVAADNSINSAASAFGSFAAGQWIEVRGFTGTNTTANGYFRIATATAAKLVLEGGAAALIDDSAGESVTVTMGAQIVNGTTQRSISFEREYSDLSNVWKRFTGNVISSFTLNIPSGEIATLRFDCMGKLETTETSGLSTGTVEPVNTNGIMSTGGEVLRILENLSVTTAKELNITLNNNIRERPVVGSISPDSLGSGTVGITGDLQKYFASNTLMDKYLDQTESSIAVVLEDSAGNAYVVDIPRIRYTGGRDNAEGKDQDVMTNLPWTAYRHSTQDVTIRIARFAA